MRLERAFDSGIEHVGNAQARLGIELAVPCAFEQRARGGIRDVTVGRQLMRERAHVAGALHVVLAAQRVHADARTADVAGRHGEVGDRHDGRGALAMLGDAEAVVDRAIAAGGKQPGCGAHSAGVDARVLFHGFGRILRLGDECGPLLELGPVAALAHEVFVDQAFCDDDVRHRGQQGDVGARLQRQMVVGFDVGRAHEIGAARIGDDELGAGTQPRFIRLAKTGWPSVGLAPMTRMTSQCSTESKSCVPADFAEGGLQAIARRRMADAGAGIDVVDAEALADKLLHEEDIFVRAARRRDAADRALAILRLDAAEFGGNAPMASSHVVSRQGSVILSRTMGFMMRSRCVA